MIILYIFFAQCVEPDKNGFLRRASPLLVRAMDSAVYDFRLCIIYKQKLKNN